MSWVARAPDSEHLSEFMASQSLNPAAPRAHAALYEAIVAGDSPLSHSEREFLAVAVSALNGAHY
jgi:hypothetical protein